MQPGQPSSHLSSLGQMLHEGRFHTWPATTISTLKEQVQNLGECACAFIGVQRAPVLPGSGHRGHEMSCRKGLRPEGCLEEEQSRRPRGSSFPWDFIGRQGMQSVNSGGTGVQRRM